MTRNTAASATPSHRQCTRPTSRSPDEDGAAFQARTAGGQLAAVTGCREAIRQVDANLPLIGMTAPLGEVESRRRQQKVFAHGSTIVGGLALLVVSAGLFGLMWFNVARRMNEFSIRAWRAATGCGAWLVIGDSVFLVGPGVTIGFGGAIAVSGLRSHLLFGLAPTAPMAMVGAMAVMVLVSALAGYLPARRASGIDPFAPSGQRQTSPHASWDRS